MSTAQQPAPADFHAVIRTSAGTTVLELAGDLQHARRSTYRLRSHIAQHTTTTAILQANVLGAWMTIEEHRL